MGAVTTPVFYIFGIVAIASAIIVCGFTPLTVLVALFLVLPAAAGAADYNRGIVPDLIPIAIAALAIAKMIFDGITVQSVLLHIAGAACLSVPMLIVALLIKKGFGGGDIKLIAAAGLYMSLDKTLIAGFITFILAGLYGIYLLLTKKKRPGSTIRLAPFIALGCAFSELFGSDFLTIISMQIARFH